MKTEQQPAALDLAEFLASVALFAGLELADRTILAKEVTLVVLEPGVSVGEIALLTGERRSASVYADEACDIYSLTTQAFESLRQQSPHTIARFSRSIVDRLQRGELQNILYVSDLFGNMSKEALMRWKKSLN